MREDLGKIGAVLAADGRRLRRDRTALFFIFALPAFIILIVGIGIGGANNTLKIGVVDKGSGPLGTELRRDLARSRRLKLDAFGSADSLRAAVRHSEVLAGVIIATGYDAALRSGRPVGVEFVVDPAAQASLAARGAVAAAVDAQAGTVAAARLASSTTGTSFEDGYRRARSLAASGGGVDVDVSTATGRAPLPLGFSYTAPSNLVLFVFITSLAAGGAIVFAKRLGVTRRMLATPTPPSVVLAGQAGSRFLTAVFQGLFILVLGALVFGVDWGDLLAAGVLILVFALMATGAALIIGTVARTEEQAGTVGPPIGIALGMLGGCMWPLVIVPPVMRTIGHGTPHAWAMDGFIALVARGAHLRQVAPDLLALAAFAALFLAVGTWRLRRSILR
jgi:ABC-2 type transport system permease protein